MVISIVFFIVFMLILIYQFFLKEFINVTVVYKSLIKVLDSRDLLVLNMLPEIKNKKMVEEILNLINERKVKSKISYDDAIHADLALHNKLKGLYNHINQMKRNELQEELFKRIIDFEKKLRVLRKKYSKAVEEYNISLTIHPKIFVKILHMKPLEMYALKS